jgi:hypothetical protein
MPLGSQLGLVSLSQFLGKVRAELATPFADGFVAQLDAAPGHPLFHISIAYGETEIEPNHLADHFAGEPMTTIEVRWDIHYCSVSYRSRP